MPYRRFLQQIQDWTGNTSDLLEWLGENMPAGNGGGMTPPQNSPSYTFTQTISGITVNIRGWYFPLIKQSYLFIDLTGTATAEISQELTQLSFTLNLLGNNNQSVIIPIFSITDFSYPVSGYDIAGAIKFSKDGRVHLNIAEGAIIGGNSGSGFSDCRWVITA